MGRGSEEAVKSGAALGSFVDFSGVVIVGPGVKEPVVMGVFDVRELLKRMAAKSGKGAVAGDFAEGVVAKIKEKVAGSWGEMGKAERSVGAYHGEVVVFASASVVREVSMVLQDMMK